MARVQLPLIVINPEGQPVNGASVNITRRSNGAPATWYTQETGGTGSTAAAVTGANGRLTNVWLDRGAYSLAVTGTGITAFTETFDAAPASDLAIDTAWLSANVLLPGELKLYGGANPPSGWLLCDGSSVSRTEFAALFAALGGTSSPYGLPDANNFSLPDLRGRVPVGAGTAGTGGGAGGTGKPTGGSALTARARGAFGGAESHVLDTTELPPHTHAGTTGNEKTSLAHSHSGTTGNENSSLVHQHATAAMPGRYGGQPWGRINVANDAGSGWKLSTPQCFDGGIGDFAATDWGGPSAHTHNFGTSNNGPPAHAHDFTTGNGPGTSTAHNNVQPFVAVTYIIKT